MCRLLHGFIVDRNWKIMTVYTSHTQKLLPARNFSGNYLENATLDSRKLLLRVDYNRFLYFGLTKKATN